MHEKHAYAGDNIRSLWSMAYQDFSIGSLLAFVPVYFVFAAWTSGLAIPSGSFSPMVFLGSCIGRLCAHLLQQTGIVTEPDAGLYSLLGAAGFFTGAHLWLGSWSSVKFSIVYCEKPSAPYRECGCFKVHTLFYLQVAAPCYLKKAAFCFSAVLKAW